MTIEVTPSQEEFLVPTPADFDLSKTVMFTDIHWGARNNSVQHNQDNLEYMRWMIQVVKKERPTAVLFLGDWFENRNSINVMTLNMSYEGLKELNAVGVPIYMLVGNHDIHGRHNRNVHSVLHFSELSNVHVVDHPMSNGKHLLCPFLFKEEYPKIAPVINSHEFIYGHFEFRDFVVTGTSKTLDHGPDHNAFDKPKFIFSGHYHKRQARDNIVFIGNTFSTNYGDVDDPHRGCCVFDAAAEKVWFEDWPDAPRFMKTKLSDVVEGNWAPVARARVRCLLDIDIAYSDAQTLKDEMVKAYALREFQLEENFAAKAEAIEGMAAEEIELGDITLKEAVSKMIESGVAGAATISASTLVGIWNDL